LASARLSPLAPYTARHTHSSELTTRASGGAACTYLIRHTPATRPMEQAGGHVGTRAWCAHTSHARPAIHKSRSGSVTPRMLSVAAIPQDHSLGRSSEWPCGSPRHACTLCPSPRRHSYSCRLPLFRRACGGLPCPFSQAPRTGTLRSQHSLAARNPPVARDGDAGGHPADGALQLSARSPSASGWPPVVRTPRSEPL